MLTISEEVSVVIVGNYTQSQTYSTTSGILIKKNACVVIQGDCTVHNFSTFSNSGTVDVAGNLTISSHVSFENFGEIFVKGDVAIDKWVSGDFIINGSSPQTIYGNFYN